jgi:hypothetical protein
VSERDRYRLSFDSVAETYERLNSPLFENRELRKVEYVDEHSPESVADGV